MAQQEGTNWSGSGGEKAGPSRLSRRQVMGRAGAVATAGVAAWVVPEILVAQPGSAAGLSGSPGGAGASVGTSASVSTDVGGASAGAGASASTTNTDTDPDVGASTGVSADAVVEPPGGQSSHTTRAGSGFAIGRDGEAGAALVDSGWSLRHWSPNRG